MCQHFGAVGEAVVVAVHIEGIGAGRGLGREIGGRRGRCPQRGGGEELESRAGGGREVQRETDSRRWARIQSCSAADVRDELGAGGGAVALPQLPPFAPSWPRRRASRSGSDGEEGRSSARPGRMSSTSTVPAAVPSLFHSSTPVVPSLAVKKSVPFTFVETAGSEPVAPGLMSLTSTVPAAGAVALPQLAAAGAVVGREEERAVHVRQDRRETNRRVPGRCP